MEKVYGVWMTVPDGALDEMKNPIIDGWVFVTTQEMMFHTRFVQIANIQADQWNKLSATHEWKREFGVCEVGMGGEPVEMGGDDGDYALDREFVDHHNCGCPRNGKVEN